MAKKRKTNRAKKVKQQSLFLTFVLAILKIIARFIRWVLWCLYLFSRKNPLYAAGLLLFFIGFGFVSFNALFAQTGRHHGVFVETRPNLKADNFLQNDAINYEIKANNRLEGLQISADEKQINNNVSASTVPVPQLKPQSAVKNVSETLSLLDAQKKLARLGFYKGPIDGLDGPKTRAAIAAYNVNQKNLASALYNPQRQNDAIATLIIAKNNNQPSALDKVTTQSIAKQQNQKTNPVIANNIVAQDVTKVQKALKLFGHDAVEITGKQDEQTMQALRKFQEIFSLNITGQVNDEVLNKMKEIGLLS